MTAEKRETPRRTAVPDSPDAHCLWSADVQGTLPSSEERRRGNATDENPQPLPTERYPLLLLLLSRRLDKHLGLTTDEVAVVTPVVVRIILPETALK